MDWLNSLAVLASQAFLFLSKLCKSLLELLTLRSEAWARKLRHLFVQIAFGGLQIIQHTLDFRQLGSVALGS